MPAPRLWTWRRLAAVTLARSLLVGLIGLAAWGALPAVIGWHPTTVSSGSMMPRLHVGDIAVSRPLGSHVPPLSSVLLFHDPDHAGRLRMHRFVRLDDDGLLVTRGDANVADDSTPVAIGAVVGIGTLRVPWIALPIVWLREGQWVLLGLVAAGLALALGVATSSRNHTFGDDEPGPGPDGADGLAPDAVDSADVAAAPLGAHRAAHGPERSPAHSTASWHAPRRVATLLGAALLATSLATPADAAFLGRTVNPSDALAASTYFSCANAVAAYAPYFWYRMDETSSTATTATDSSGSARDGVYGSAGKTTTTAKACVRDSGRAMTYDGSSGYLSSSVLSGALPNTFTESIWFRTATKAGGKLIGFGNNQTGASSVFDRHVYMTNTGTIVFGVYPGSVQTVSSSAAYNDNVWHLAVATLSSAGMRLYVDGSLVASNAGVTTGEGRTGGYVRVAYDNVDGWPNTPTSRFFAGTLDDAAYFVTALTDAQVRALYEAGTT